MEDGSASAAASAEYPEVLGILAQGASLVLENASDLYNEATILHAAGALSRALALHQFSLEECAKIDMLGAWATSVVAGMQVDAETMAQAFRSHKAKNYTNAYKLPTTDGEIGARRQKRWTEALAAFKEQQAEFHRDSNWAKNAALYVDMQNGSFTAPKDVITHGMVSEIARTNGEQLAGAFAEVRMLERWVTNPGHVREMVTWFGARLEELRSESNDPEQAFASIMDEVFARAKATGYAEAMGGAFAKPAE